MNLFIKISRFDLTSYRKEFLECLKHNSENHYISSIIVYTDEVNHKITGFNKVKVYFKKNLPTDSEIVILSKSFAQNKNILSKPFVKFNEDLYKVTDGDLENFIIKNSDYIIFSKNSGLINQNQNEVKFDKPNKSINLFTNSVNITLNNVNENQNKNILIKKSVSKPSQFLPTKRSKKIDVVIVSVNYNDYLILTLKENIKLFDNITVVTSSADTLCQEICRKYEVNCIVTDVMYENGSTFNKGKAINEGIKSIENPDIILLLDADIIVNSKINLSELSDEVLYTSERIILENYKTYTDYIEHGITKRSKLEGDKGYGFFQLFCINNTFIDKNKVYSEEHDDASYADIEFRDRFNSRQTISNPCLHIGEAFRNWKGRITDKFITDSELLKLISEIKPFGVNTYFDKIYCLNLDIRTDRWKNVSTQFDKFGITVERWTAIKGEDINDEVFFDFNPENISGEEASKHGIAENKNAVACLMSHLEIIKDAKSKGYKRILIFEDDVKFIENFHSEFKKVKDKDWKLLYLGASQFDWSRIEKLNGFYKCKNTLGTFAYAVDSSIYEDIINLYQNGKKSVDNLLTEIQLNNYNNCFVLLPNIVISDVGKSDIRESKNIHEYSKQMRWNLDLIEKQNNKKKILILPDVEDWAFDNIAKSIIKYNPYPNIIEYHIKYIKNIHSGSESVIIEDWDLIFVMWEAERCIPDSNNVIRGCYSAFWLENSYFSEKKISEYFELSGGAVFANDFLKESICKFLPRDFKQTVIHDSTDEAKFYPIENIKERDFTAIFVGNTTRKIKNYEDIVDICKKTGIKLITCTDIKNDELVQYYNKSDICINFSTFEGGPQTFLESSLCEVPMLIRSNNELSKLIPCFRGDDKDDFIRIINELKNDREKCREVGKEARKIVLKNFTYKKTAKKFAEFFLKKLEIYVRDLSELLTVFVIRAGENPNYEDCFNSLLNQTVKFNLIEIKDVAPMSAAFQRMIDECKTEYYIQVDEDMILFEDTIEKIYNRLLKSENKINMVAHMLNDEHLDFNIYGIKGYKHSIMKNYSYNLEIISCEVEQMTRLQNDGFETLMYPDVVGYHSPKWTEQLIYERYFDLMEKWKIFKYDWLDELPAKLLQIFKSKPNNINLFALMGAITSISNESPMRNREKNFLIKDKNFERLEGLVSKKEFKFIRNDKNTTGPQILDKNYVKK
jgi:GR25 family glycosyltransferase involved in LPS biosynthesis